MSGDDESSMDLLRESSTRAELASTSKGRTAISGCCLDYAGDDNAVYELSAFDETEFLNKDQVDVASPAKSSLGWIVAACAVVLLSAILITAVWLRRKRESASRKNMTRVPDEEGDGESSLRGGGNAAAAIPPEQPLKPAEASPNDRGPSGAPEADPPADPAQIANAPELEENPNASDAREVSAVRQQSGAEGASRAKKLLKLAKREGRPPKSGSSRGPRLPAPGSEGATELLQPAGPAKDDAVLLDTRVLVDDRAELSPPVGALSGTATSPCEEALPPDGAPSAGNGAVAIVPTPSNLHVEEHLLDSNRTASDVSGPASTAKCQTAASFQWTATSGKGVTPPIVRSSPDADLSQEYYKDTEEKLISPRSASRLMAELIARNKMREKLEKQERLRAFRKKNCDERAKMKLQNWSSDESVGEFD